MKAAMRVLVMDGVGKEKVIPCYEAIKHPGRVSLITGELEATEIKSGTVMVLGDDGKCVHQWVLQAE